MSGWALGQWSRDPSNKVQGASPGQNPGEPESQVLHSMEHPKAGPGEAKADSGVKKIRELVSSSREDPRASPDCELSKPGCCILRHNTLVHALLPELRVKKLNLYGSAVGLLFATKSRCQKALLQCCTHMATLLLDWEVACTKEQCVC